MAKKDYSTRTKFNRKFIHTKNDTNIETLKVLTKVIDTTGTAGVTQEHFFLTIAEHEITGY